MTAFLFPVPCSLFPLYSDDSTYLTYYIKSTALRISLLHFTAPFFPYPNCQSPTPVPQSPLDYRVGYQNVSTIAGSKALANAFVNIGGNGCHLTDIVPSGYTGSCKGAIAIQELDSFGMSANIYKWYDGGTGRYATKGWYKGQTHIEVGDANDAFFEYGTGLWVSGIEGGVLPFSGEVKLANVSLPLIQGSKMLGNPYPVTLKLLRDITPTGYTGSCKGAISIQELDAFGMSANIYKWYDGGTGRYATKGWYKGQTLITTDTDVEIAKSGEGMWVTGIEGSSLSITCPISMDK